MAAVGVLTSSARGACLRPSGRWAVCVEGLVFTGLCCVLTQVRPFVLTCGQVQFVLTCWRVRVYVPGACLRTT